MINCFITTLRFKLFNLTILFIVSNYGSINVLPLMWGHIGVTNIRWVRRSKYLRAVRVFGLMFKTSEALNNVGLFPHRLVFVTSNQSLSHFWHFLPAGRGKFVFTCSGKFVFTCSCMARFLLWLISNVGWAGVEDGQWRLFWLSKPGTIHGVQQYSWLLSSWWVANQRTSGLLLTGKPVANQKTSC